MDKHTALLLDTVRHARAQMGTSVQTDWRFSLPVLSTNDVVLREVQRSDAAVLANLLTAPEVTRFISAPPNSVEGFERFIAASQRMRAAGEGACFAVTLKGCDTPIGIVQLRQNAPSEGEAAQIGGAMDTAEWGFAVGSLFWGTGIFEAAASLMIEFAFETVHVHRLEARCAVKNGRGTRALQKVGAVAEGVLRNAFVCHGELLDQRLFAILEEDWRAGRTRARAAHAERVH